MPQFRKRLFVSDSLQIPTKGPPSLYVEPVKRALQVALLSEEQGEFTELPNGIMFKRGYVAQRYAPNHFNAFDSLCLTVKADSHGVVVSYRLGLKNALQKLVFIVVISASMILVWTNLRGVLLATFIGFLACAVQAAISRILELRARTWLERVAQAPAAVTRTVGET